MEIELKDDEKVKAGDNVYFVNKKKENAKIGGFAGKTVKQCKDSWKSAGDEVEKITRAAQVGPDEALKAELKWAWDNLIAVGNDMDTIKQHRKQSDELLGRSDERPDAE